MIPRKIKLNNGALLPTVGLGTYKSPPGEVERAVKTAIEAGYRHIDCAWFYGNETEVGKAIRAKIASRVVKREDLFITSKLWNNFHAKEEVIPKMKESLYALGLDYLDLYLIHWPFGTKVDAPLMPTENHQKYFSNVDYLETWKELEEGFKLGLTKSIGLSNFNAEQVERVLQNCTIKPVVNQVECNPNLNQKKLNAFCRERGIVLVGYCPLGRGGNASKPGLPKATIFDPKVAAIGKKYNKSPAQVVLNYLVSLGISVIPKSVTRSRIVDNINIFDFTLSPEDKAYLDSCNNNQRVCPLTEFKTHKCYSFSSEF